METVNILLFDIDGVIIDPRSYREAARSTLNLLLRTMAVADCDRLLPTGEEMSFFEANGIHDVWDVTNIVFCQFLSASCVVGARADLTKPDFKAFVERMDVQGKLLHPPSVALALLSDDLRRQLGEANAQRWIAMMAECLNGSRSVYKSYVTRLFQDFLLGAEVFQSTYDLASDCGGVSILETEDRTLLSDASVAKLKSLQGLSDWKIAIYTARPSWPPAFTGQSHIGYSPEAEMALDIAAISGFPLIGMGTMDWLAKNYDQPPEDLVKPHKTQAFAALLGAINGSLDQAVLEQAYNLGKLDQGSLDRTILGPFKQSHLNINVFEDTISGIMPMCAVADKLRTQGYSVTLNCLGIATDTAKCQALSKFASKVYPVVNEALDFVTQQNTPVQPHSTAL